MNPNLPYELRALAVVKASVGDGGIAEALREAADALDKQQSENDRLREAGERALLNMQVMGNILNWPPEIPQDYADAINELREALGE